MQRRTLLGALAAASFSVAFGLPAMAQDKPIKIGVTAGPHAQVMEVVKKVAERDGLKIQVVEFSDFVQPNAALAAGDLDANSYQHLPYMEAQNKDRGYKLAAVAQTITFPLTFYSQKLKSFGELKNGARVGIPNDPTNGGRALLLLQAQGVIKLKADAGLKATPLDIAENPKQIKLVELDAAQLARSLADLDAAAINGSYASPAGLDPVRDGIATESAKGPYANIIAVREADKTKPWVAKLIKAYQSDEVKKFVQTQFKGGMIAAW